MNDELPIQIEFTPLFVRFLKHLAKKFRHVRNDLEPLLDQLANGETPGNQIKGTRHTTYKVRVRNTDAQKGISGGYRVIYYLKAIDRVILLAIYSKTDQVDISAHAIRRMMDDYAQESD
jgi:mRNA-degrading endonuclease RelE of RelBE toxin-antitoxin system